MHVRVESDCHVGVVVRRVVKGTLILKSVDFFSDGFFIEPHTSINVICPELGISESLESPDHFLSVVRRIVWKLCSR